MTDWFEELEPYYMAIGMPHDQYWDGEAWLVWVFREAHKKYIDMRSQEMWLQGLYNFRAFTTALTNFSHALSGKKKRFTPEQYPSDYLRLNEPTEQEKIRKMVEEQEKQLSKWRRMERQAAFEERQQARAEKQKAKQMEKEVTERAND